MKRTRDDDPYMDKLIDPYIMDKLIGINTTNIEIARRVGKDGGPTFEVFGIKRVTFSHSTLSLEIRKIHLLEELPKPDYKPNGTELDAPYDYTRYLEYMESSLIVNSPIYKDLTTKLQLVIENIHVKLGVAETKLLEIIGVVNKLYTLFPVITIPDYHANKHYRCLPRITTTTGSLKIDSLSFEVDGTDVCKTKLVEIVGGIYSIDTEIPGWGNGSTLLRLDQTFAGPKGQRHVSNGSVQGSFSVNFRGSGYIAHAIGLNIPQNHMADGYMLCPLIKSVVCRGSVTEIGDFGLDVGGRIFFDFIVSETDRTISIYNHDTKRLIYQFENCYDLELMYPEFVWDSDDDVEIYDDLLLGTARFV